MSWQNLNCNLNLTMKFSLKKKKKSKLKSFSASIWLFFLSCFHWDQLSFFVLFFSFCLFLLSVRPFFDLFVRLSLSAFVCFSLSLSLCFYFSLFLSCQSGLRLERLLFKPGVAKPLPGGKKLPAKAFSCALQTFFLIAFFTLFSQICKTWY